jgi:hypothetical protein
MEVVGMAGTAEVTAAVASGRQPVNITTQVEKLVISAETAHQRLQMSVFATNASNLAMSRPHALTSLLKPTTSPTSATLRHFDTLELLSLEELCPRTFGIPHRRDNELRHPSLLVSWFRFAAIAPLLLPPS